MGIETFLFAKEGADLSPVNVTFNIDMSNTETSEGVFLAGGDAFGSPGDNPMTHAPELGEHVYTITKQISAYYFGNYIFTNGSSAGWDAKEQLGGQDCADGDSYNDRLLYTMNEDVTINGCLVFAVVHFGEFDIIYVPDPVAVTFQLDTLNVPCHNPFVTGTFDGWSSGGLELTLDETLGAYTGTVILCQVSININLFVMVLTAQKMFLQSAV